jgi:hypothetical protein
MRQSPKLNVAAFMFHHSPLVPLWYGVTKREHKHTHFAHS